MRNSLSPTCSFSFLSFFPVGVVYLLHYVLICSVDYFSHDLDNILLENLGNARTLQAVFELEALVLTGKIVFLLRA